MYDWAFHAAAFTAAIVVAVDLTAYWKYSSDPEYTIRFKRSVYIAPIVLIFYGFWNLLG